MPDTPSQTPGYQRFFAELKRREVFRVAAVYGAVGFVVLQVADLLAEGLALPDVVLRTATYLVLLGFPIAVVLAWAYERTAAGVKRTDPAATGELDAIAAQSAGKRWPAGLLAVAGAIALLAGAWWVGRSTAPGSVDPGAAPGVAASAEGVGGRDEAVLQLAYADLSEDARPSIAVLPFVNMSSDEEQEYFADGMTEELLNALVKIRELRVAGRTSSFAYKGQDRDLREIGEELGVRYLVEGSVRKQDDRLRITAQLVDAESSFHLWSETYDRTMEDIFAVQTEIAESIAEELEVSLGLSGDQTLVIPTEDLGAYELYLAAQARLRDRRDGVEDAVRLFGASVARDSSFAPAWSGLAQAHAIVPYYGGSPENPVDSTFWANSLASAELAARRALELDSTNAAAEVALANVFRDRREWRAAEAHYLRALEIDPDNVEAHQQYAEYLGAIGRLGEALRSARRGAELDPTSAIRLFVFGYVLRDNGRYAEAVSAQTRATELDPLLLRAHRGLVEAYAGLGDWDRAETHTLEVAIPLASDRFPMIEDDRAELEHEIAAYYEAMRTGDAAALEACCSDYANPWSFALLGDMERALDALSGLISDDPGYGTTWQGVLWEQAWDGVRSDSRFQEVLRHWKLEEFEPHRAPPGS